MTNQTNKALEKSGEAPIAQAQTTGTPVLTTATSGDATVSLKRADMLQRDGIGSQISGWFSSKLSALKAGASRLNNKILKGVMKYASKFNNSEEDRKAVALAMNEERAFTAKDVKDEHENDGLFMEFQGKAAQLNQGIHTLAERENQGQ